MRLPRFVIPVLVASALAGCGGGGGGGGTPAVPTSLSIAGLPSSAKLTAESTYTLSVLETGNGQSFTPGSVTFSLDTAAVGTITGTTLKTGDVNATGHITATDSSRGLSATLTVSVGTTHPATNGDTAAFSGTLTERIVRPLASPVSTQPTYTFNYAVSIASTTSTGKTFGTKTGLIDFTTVETDTGSTPPLPVTTTNTYEELEPTAAGTVNVLSPGSAASDTNGSTYTTDNGIGNGLLDILPETGGRTWHNTAYGDYLETEADTTSIKRATSPNGAYTETDTFADTTQPAAQIAVNADLSGTYSNATVPAYGLLDITVGAPQGSGASSHIPITLVQAGVTAAGDVADWYPTKALYASTASLAASQTIPSACRVPAAVGTIASEIVEKTTRLDPVLGTYELRTNDTYLVPFYGTACTIDTDILDDYYDYSGQSVQTFASTPQQTTTLVETLGFTSGSISGAAVAREATQSSVDRTAVAVGRAGFERAIERLYRQRRLALRTFLRTHTSTLRIGR